MSTNFGHSRKSLTRSRKTQMTSTNATTSSRQKSSTLNHAKRTKPLNLRWTNNKNGKNCSQKSCPAKRKSVSSGKSLRPTSWKLSRQWSPMKSWRTTLQSWTNAKKT